MPVSKEACSFSPDLRVAIAHAPTYYVDSSTDVPSCTNPSHVLDYLKAWTTHHSRPLESMKHQAPQHTLALQQFQALWPKLSLQLYQDSPQLPQPFYTPFFFPEVEVRYDDRWFKTPDFIATDPYAGLWIGEVGTRHKRGQLTDQAVVLSHLFQVPIIRLMTVRYECRAGQLTHLEISCCPPEKQKLDTSKGQRLYDSCPDAPQAFLSPWA